MKRRTDKGMVASGADAGRGSYVFHFYFRRRPIARAESDTHITVGDDSGELAISDHGQTPQSCFHISSAAAARFSFSPQHLGSSVMMSRTFTEPPFSSLWRSPLKPAAIRFASGVPRRADANGIGLGREPAFQELASVRIGAFVR
jgi:hypothetical protein